jgi:hypothetical protein
MKIALPLCLLIACGAPSSELALAAPRNHRPAATHSGSADDAAKSPITPGTSTDAGTSSTAAGELGNAPIDTSITVNQGHIRDSGNRDTGNRDSGKHSVFKQPKIGTVEPTIVGHTKTRLPPVNSAGTHTSPHRNAVGSVVEHIAPGAPRRPAAAGTEATPPSHPGLASVGAVGTAPLPPKGSAAISAANNDHGAAALKTVTTNGASINGTGAKPTMATAAVGGPAKTVAAAAGGASFHPRHP